MVFLCYSGEKESRVSPPLKVTVARKKRVIDQVFLTSVIILVSIIFINFGCALDWEFLRQSLKRPIGPGIGMFSQFIIMPLVRQANTCLLKISYFNRYYSRLPSNRQYFTAKPITDTTLLRWYQ